MNNNNMIFSLHYNFRFQNEAQNIFCSLKNWERTENKERAEEQIHNFASILYVKLNIFQFFLQSIVFNAYRYPKLDANSLPSFCFLRC
jgi:hypothetical protein